MKELFTIKNIALLATYFTASAYAEIVVDNSLGTAQILAGPDFHISNSLGKQVGANLFHSFELFNLEAHETAIFSGTSDIRNVITRVTGNSASQLNGTLQLTIPGADFYFLNPAGIHFGPYANLDVQGSFYASTANYLRLGEVGRFEASQPMHSVFTAEMPSAFGFFNKPAEISKTAGKLRVSEGNTLSFIGGNLTLKESQRSYLAAEAGHIHLLSLASSGEVPVSSEKIPLEDFEHWGRIEIMDDSELNLEAPFASNINVIGRTAGQIYMQASEIILHNAYLFADTLFDYGNKKEQGIRIIASDKLQLLNGSKVTTDTFGGDAGNIFISAQNIELRGGSQITTLANRKGNAGNISVNATNTLLIEGIKSLSPEEYFNSALISKTKRTGKAGNIKVTTSILKMENRGEIQATSEGNGDAGRITIETEELSLQDGARIRASSGHNATMVVDGHGQGGILEIEATESILITGHSNGIISGIMNNVFTAGQGGVTEITSPQIKITNKGAIQTGTRGFGNAGKLVLNTNHLLMESSGNITASTHDETGKGGDIVINAKYIQLTDSEIKASSSGAGDAGDLNIHANDFIQMKNSGLHTSTIESDGGNISLNSLSYLYLTDSKVTTNVSAENGNGGNINIEQPQFAILQHSEINASAIGGNGGNIVLMADFLAQSTDSLVDASSQRQVNGQIVFNAIDLDVSEALVLQVQPLDMRNQVMQACEWRGLDEVSRMRISNIQAVAPPDALPWKIE